MHEITLVSGLFEIINRQVIESGIESISEVRLKVGELAGIEPMTLRACFEVVAEGTVARGARLVIDQVPLTGRCLDCRAGFRIIGFSFRCPHCRGESVEVASGKELYIESVEAICRGDHNEKAA